MFDLESARSGRFLTPDRVRRVSAALLAAELGVVAWLFRGPGVLDPVGRPVGTDFVSFWSVSRLVLSGDAAAAYSPDRLRAAEVALTNLPEYFAWYYPPVALLVVAPLALVPYLWSLVAWNGSGVIAYAALSREIGRDGHRVLAAIAFPAVFSCVGHGQTTIWWTVILTSALLCLPSRPAVAGALFALLAIKPQLALIVPLALLAARQWIALATAAAAAGAFVAGSAAVFGWRIWKAWFGIVPSARAALDLGQVAHFKMQSAYAAVRVLGGGARMGETAQLAVTCAAAAAVAWVWSRDCDQRLKNVALACGAVLATPFVLDYDLVVLGPALLWLVATWERRRPVPWESCAVCVCWMWPAAARIAASAHVPLTPVVVGSLLATVVRAAARDGASAIS